MVWIQIAEANLESNLFVRNPLRGSGCILPRGVPKEVDYNMQKQQTENKNASRTQHTCIPLHAYDKQMRGKLMFLGPDGQWVKPKTPEQLAKWRKSGGIADGEVPDFSLVDVAAGSPTYGATVDRPDFPGGPLLLYFALPTCGHCQAQVQQLQTMWNENAARWEGEFTLQIIALAAG